MLTAYNLHKKNEASSWNKISNLISFSFSVCLINLHRLCVKLYDDMCPGPINKKDRGIGKFIRIRHENSDHRRKASSHFIQRKYILIHAKYYV